MLSVLKGDDTRKAKKVLKSNENSNIFFYFVDHGAPGFSMTATGEKFTAVELNDTLKYMHENKMYNEMVIYWETCESGSMFKNILANDINIYALSAANAKESSWGTYCASSKQDIVDGVHMGTCLGDLFSVNFMQDSDKGDLKDETLKT